jgi:glycosyltransferase involved in cell wall biosynthesis
VRILAILPNPTGWITRGVIPGGVIRMIKVFNIWNKNGVEIETIESPPSSRLLNATYTTHEFDLGLRMRNGMVTSIVSLLGFALYTLKLLFAMRLRGKRFDVIFCGVGISEAIFGKVAKWLFKSPVIVVMQATDNYVTSVTEAYRVWRSHQKTRLQASIMALGQFISTTMMKDASAFICVSNTVASSLRRSSVPSAKIHITGNAVDCDEISKIDTNFNKYDAIFCSRIEEEKGILDLIKAWHYVTQRRQNSTLIILGSGSLLAEAKRSATQYGLNKEIIFVGHVIGYKRFSYFKSSKVFVFPIKEKEIGWGLVVAEALACGLPVVCYDNPTLREIFGSCKSVIFVPVGNVEELAKNVLYLLKNEEVLSEYSKISKEYAKRFSWDAIAKKELEIVKSIIRHAKTSG